MNGIFDINNEDVRTLAELLSAEFERDARRFDRSLSLEEDIE